MLVILGVWRYVFKRFPFHYDPLYWGAVFPVGMYAVATLQMARAMDLGFLGWVPRYFVYLAILGWTATFMGFAATMGRSLIAWAVG
jgi:tellurite resistance protein TehA-like permease